MWIIEHEKLKEGGLVQWNEPYYLRHLSTGFYLGGKIIDKKDESINGKIVIDNEISRSNLFKFIPISSTFSKVSPKHKKYVARESFALIQHANSSKILHGVFEKDQYLKKSEIEGDTTSIQAIKPALISFTTANEEASIKLIKANYNEVWETNFLISSFPILKNFHETLRETNKKGAIDNITMSLLVIKMEQIERCIRNLDAFCNNKLFNTSSDHKFGEINQFRQKLLKEQFFIDIVIMILKEILTKTDFEIYEKYTVNKKTEKNFEITKAKVLTDFASKSLNITGLESK